MLTYLALYPFRLIGSAIYWARFRVGGATRARMTSIEIDTRQLWEYVFTLQRRISDLESHETERRQAVLFERVLDKYPEKR